MELEWLTVDDFARDLGVSPNAVRYAIRRRELKAVGAYYGDRWTLYAEKHGKCWLIPVVRKPDPGLWFETRTEYERYLRAHGVVLR